MNDDFAEAPQCGGEGERAITSRRTAGVRRWAPPLSVGPAGRASRPASRGRETVGRLLLLQAREPSPRAKRRGRKGSRLAGPLRMLEGVR